MAFSSFPVSGAAGAGKAGVSFEIGVDRVNEQISNIFLERARVSPPGNRPPGRTPCRGSVVIFSRGKVTGGVDPAQRAG